MQLQQTRQHRSSLATQRGESMLTCQMGSGSLLALQISPKLLPESQAGQGLGAGRSPTATPPVSRKRRSAGSILPASTCSPAATPNANSSLSFSNSDLQAADQQLRTKDLAMQACDCNGGSVWRRLDKLETST